MASYKLNHIVFDDELNLLKTEQEEHALDPKLAELLLFFVSNHEKILSRDDLLDNVWANTVVSDNTINWSISQLRKSLGDDAKSPTFIRTISKKGYQFVAAIQPVTEHTKPLSVRAESNTQRWPLSILAVIIVLFASWLFFSDEIASRKDGPTAILSSYPLTTLAGQERGGSLSEDGLYVSFLHRPLNQERFSIYLKPFSASVITAKSNTAEDIQALGVKMGSMSPYPVTQDGYEYHQVIWGWDNLQLLAVRSIDDVCEIIELRLTQDRQSLLEQRVVSQCRNPFITKVAISDTSDELYIVGALGATTRQDLYVLDLKSNTETLLLEASGDGAGFKFLDVHRTTGALLLLQDLYLRETSFVTFQPSTGESTQLFHLESLYYSAYWANHPNRLWFNWGNDTVMEYDIETKSRELLLQTTVGFNYDFHSVSEDLAIYSTSDADVSNLAFVTKNQASTTPTPYREYGPQFSHKGNKLAYVSNQSGLPQIWLNEAGQTSQITNTQEYREFYDLAWLLDDTGIIGVSGKTIGLLDLKNNEFRTFLEAEHKPFSPTIAAGQSYFAFSQFHQGTWSVEVFGYSEGDTPANHILTLANAIKAVFVDESRFLFSKHNTNGLWMYDLKQQSTSLLWEAFPADVIWWELSGKDLVYFIDGNIVKCQILDEISCSNSASIEKVTDIPEFLSGQFTYNVATDEVVMTDQTRPESNLRISKLSKNNN